MSYFSFREAQSFCEDVRLSDLALALGTPLYIYSSSGLKDRIEAYKKAFADYPTSIHYAVKANSNLELLALIFKAGLGADLVSQGEIRRSLKAGGRPRDMAFAGVGKTKADLSFALSAQVGTIHVESVFELEMLAQLAQDQQKLTQVALRVNPHIDAKTHPKIATGLKSTKFGLDPREALQLLARFKDYPFLNLRGIACHIGSQLLDLKPLAEAATALVSLSQQIKKAGFELEFLDLGGGLGIPYQWDQKAPSLRDYAHALTTPLQGSGLRLQIEPGRSLIAEQGELLCQVIGTKQQGANQFLVVDAGMNDLIRPTLYEAYHDILPERAPDRLKTGLWDVVGPVCETGDYLGLKRPLPTLSPGEWVRIKNTGAYGMSMASNYNSRPSPAEVLVEGDQYRVIRRRETYEDLWRMEI